MPNLWGLYDLQGNAWEIVADGQGPYGVKAAVDPLGIESGTDHIVRGGTIGQPPRNQRSTKRVHGPLDDLGAGVGARSCAGGPRSLYGGENGKLERREGKTEKIK